MPIDVQKSEFEGAKKSTCKEAMKLLNEGKLRKAWFRPDKFINLLDPDNDLAYIWLIEDDLEDET